MLLKTNDTFGGEPGGGQEYRFDREKVPVFCIFARSGGGYLVMEIGMAMEHEVLGLFGVGWEEFSMKTDLQGIPRTVIARKIQ